MFLGNLAIVLAIKITLRADSIDNFSRVCNNSSNEFTGAA